MTQIAEGKRDSYTVSPNASRSNVISRRQRSLNKTARKKELFKITSENAGILRRLQMKKSFYNVTKWDNENKERVNMLKNMCEYPYQFKGSPRQLPRLVNENTSTSFNIGPNNKNRDNSYMTHYNSKIGPKRSKCILQNLIFQ